MDQETIYFLNVNLLSKAKIHFFILLFDMIKYNLILEIKCDVSYVRWYVR